MNTWIKYLEKDDLETLYGKQTSQKLLGFFRKSSTYVLYCSICEEEDGTFEYYYNCNKDVAYSFFGENNFNSYEECKEALIDEITELSCSQAPMLGLDLNETTRDNQMAWDMLKIEEEYPAWYSI